MTKESFLHKLLVPLLILSSLTGCGAAQTSSKKPQVGTDGSLASITPIKDDAQNPSVQLYKLFYWSSGKKVEALMAEPTSKGKYPLVLNLHGGLIAPYNKNINFGTTVQDLENNTTANEIVLAPEYRGYMESAGTPQGLDGIVQDVNNAILAVQSLPSIRPHDIYVEGVSMGGGAALMLASERNDIKAVAAVSPFIGYDEEVKWIRKLHLSGDYKTAEQMIQTDYGPTSSSPNYTLRSPIDHVNTVQCPILILQGKKDPNTLWQEVQDYYQRITALHKNVKLVMFPTGNHALTNFAYERASDISDWFSNYGLN